MDHQLISDAAAERQWKASQTLAQRQDDINRFIEALKDMTLNQYQDEVVWARQPTENDVLQDLGEELFRLTAKVTASGFTLERVARYNLASRRTTPTFVQDQRLDAGADVPGGGAA